MHEGVFEPLGSGAKPGKNLEGAEKKHYKRHNTTTTSQKRQI